MVNARAALEEELEEALSAFEVYEDEDEELALKNLIIGLQLNAYERGIANATVAPPVTDMADAIAPITADQASSMLSGLLSSGSATIRLEIS